MKRNEFIQMTVVELIKTQKFMKSALELNQSEVENYCIMAKQIADDVAEVAPFDEEIDFEKIKCTIPDNIFMSQEEIDHERDMILSTDLKYYWKTHRISFRAYSRLDAAGIITVGDVIKHPRLELLKFRNFGKKSLTEIDQLLEDLKLEYAQYKPYNN